MKSLAGTHLIKIKNRISGAKKTAQPELDGITLDYPDLSVERRRFPESLNSGQTSSQSSGRKSLRVTAPLVACSIATQALSGTPRSPDAH